MVFHFTQYLFAFPSRMHFNPMISCFTVNALQFINIISANRLPDWCVSCNRRFQFPTKAPETWEVSVRAGNQFNPAAHRNIKRRKKSAKHFFPPSPHLIKRLSIRRRMKWKKKHASEMDRHHRVNAGLKNGKIMWKNSFLSVDNRKPIYHLSTTGGEENADSQFCCSLCPSSLISRWIRGKVDKHFLLLVCL